MKYNSAICLLEETVARYPDKIAAWDEWGEVSFSELRRVSLSIGTALLDGSDRSRPVIVMMPKSIAELECFFGALYCGTLYAPVDENIPLQRLQYIASLMQGSRLITSRKLSERLAGLDLGDITVCVYEDICKTAPDEKACLQRVASVINTDPACIMHTSGSTGRPKGVTITHRGIIDYTCWQQETLGQDCSSVLGSFSSFYFDGSIIEVYMMVYTGAKLIIIPDILNRFPSKLPEFINEHEIDTFFTVPSILSGVAYSGALDAVPMPKLRRVMFGGEVMPTKPFNEWYRRYPELVYMNVYGPNETTVQCLYYIVDREFRDDEPLPIGKPCANMRALILRPDGTECDDGETGEICMQGSGITAGYWKKNELTREVYTQNPLVSQYDDRLYHTGDLGYVAPDGNIMFLGRLDTQVKIHGNRIELGEIEKVVESMDGIENACALFNADTKEIVLFVQSQENIVLRKLNLQLGQTLPKFMLPKKLYVLPQLPLNAHGKIDRVLLKGRL